MKKIKLFMAAALLAVCGTASAQFSNTSKSGGSGTGVTDWNAITFEFAPSNITYDYDDADDQSFTGLSLSWTHGFAISKTMPLFIETGLGVQWSFYKEEDGSVEDEDDYYSSDTRTDKFNMFSLKAPVSIGYQFDLANGKVALAPYAGIDLRYNLSGKIKEEESSYWENDYTDGILSSSEERDLFDKKDMGEAWKRFQIGWHIGAKCTFSQKYTLGIAYGADFSEIAKKTKTNAFRISAGIRF